MTVSPNIHVPLIRISELSEQKITIANDNPKKVCLVYQAQHDTKESHDFLDKVFKAVQLDFAQQTSKIILKDEVGFSITTHPIFQQHDIWICLGVVPRNLGLNFEMEKYQPISFQNKQFLWADHSLDILEDPNLKKQLWVSLQKLFPTK